jgi:hypothetical protein
MFLIFEMMDTSEIARLHRICVDTLRTYIQLANKTCALLESMGSSPLSPETWYGAVKQRVAEDEAYAQYQIAREQLFDALRPIME